MLLQKKDRHARELRSSFFFRTEGIVKKGGVGITKCKSHLHTSDTVRPHTHTHTCPFGLLHIRITWMFLKIWNLRFSTRMHKKSGIPRRRHFRILSVGYTGGTTQDLKRLPVSCINTLWCITVRQNCTCSSPNARGDTKHHCGLCIGQTASTWTFKQDGGWFGLSSNPEDRNFLRKQHTVVFC